MRPPIYHWLVEAINIEGGDILAVRDACCIVDARKKSDVIDRSGRPNHEGRIVLIRLSFDPDDDIGMGRVHRAYLCDDGKLPAYWKPDVGGAVADECQATTGPAQEMLAPHVEASPGYKAPQVHDNQQDMPKKLTLADLQAVRCFSADLSREDIAGLSGPGFFYPLEGGPLFAAIRECYGRTVFDCDTIGIFDTLDGAEDGLLDWALNH